MDLSVTATGFDELDRTLAGLQQRGTTLYPVLRELADDFLDLEREQFRSEGARAQSWKPLAFSTVVSRGSAHPILDHTGALKDSLTREGAAGAVRHLTGTSMLVGSSLPYAKYHDSGTSRMPERRPVDLTPADLDRWGRAIERYLVSPLS